MDPSAAATPGYMKPYFRYYVPRSTLAVLSVRHKKLETAMTLEREWMRGAAPLAVATLLHRKEMYGYELCAALEAESGSLLKMGQSTVYTLLYSLEQRGLIRTTRRTSPSGRTRNYSSLTKAGEAWLEAQRSQWSTLVEALHRLGVRPGPVPAEVTTP